MLTLITAPVLEPVNYSQVIQHLRMDPFDEALDESSQTYIEGLITSIRKACEVFTNRAFITQTWKYCLDNFPSKNFIRIPKPPLQGISSFNIYTTSETIAYDTGTYIIDTISQPGQIVLGYMESWPSVILYPSNPIQITYIAGYGDTPEDVPDGIKQAILLQVGDLWDNREDFREGELFRPSQMLLWPYRIFW